MCHSYLTGLLRSKGINAHCIALCRYVCDEGTFRQRPRECPMGIYSKTKAAFLQVDVEAH